MTVTSRSVTALAALVLVPGLVYLFGVVLPYRANDVGAGWLSLLGSYALILAPLGALVALVGCGVQLRAVFPRSARQVSPVMAAALVAVAAICVALLAYMLSPLGRAMTAWMQD